MLRHDVPVKAPWLEALAQDISKNGLASPLLVLNQVATPQEAPRPMVVKTGQNRLRCLWKLGWKHAPCIVVGGLPEGLEGVPLKTLIECQALLGDGIIAIESNRTLRINSALVPEQMLYPQAQTRYFDVD